MTAFQSNPHIRIAHWQTSRGGNLFALGLLVLCGCSSGRYTTMYLNQLVHERAEQEVKLETMSLDLEAAQNTIMTLEMENQKLRENAGLDTDSKPIRSRRIRQEPESTPAIDDVPKTKTKEESPELEEVTSAPDLEIEPIDESESSPPVNAQSASLKRADDDEAAPDSDEVSGDAFLPTKTKPAESSKDNRMKVEDEKANEVGEIEELPDPKSGGSAKVNNSGGSTRAVAVSIDRNQTRGEDLDGQPGDEGILVVLVPRDAAGAYVPHNGSVIIEVIDSPNASKSDSSAQVAEWKFSPEEVRRAMRNSSLGKGAYLSVDWDEHRPAHEKLLLVARWKSPTGEELKAEHVIRVNLQKSTHAWDSRLRGGDEADVQTPSIATRPLDRRLDATESKSWSPSRR
jgi:hypothetical protein